MNLSHRIGPPHRTDKKPVILCFVGYYLPGQRSGGPIRSISNFVEQFSEEFCVHIVSRDRDVSDKFAYSKINANNWNTINNIPIFYSSPGLVSFFRIVSLLRSYPYNVLYLNSFFDLRFSALLILLRRFGFARERPCILAPRGEFSSGAMTLKSGRKRSYIRISNLLGLYTNVHWQASSELEAHDIQRELKVIPSYVTVAPDIPSHFLHLRDQVTSRKRGPLRLIFLSRISPKKNLHFLLRLLCKADFQAALTICGPQEDQEYWRFCQEYLGKLPINVNINIKNHIDHEQVASEFSAHDLFVFPTRGENFGHVIFEALSAGTSVLVSDQTPWRADGSGAVSVIPLDEDRWLEQIVRWSEKSEGELIHARSGALAYAKAYVDENPAIEQNRLFFSRVALAGADA